MSSLKRLFKVAVASAFAIPFAAAQTYTSCDPLNGMSSRVDSGNRIRASLTME